MLMKTDAKLLEEIEFFDHMDQPSLKRLSYLLRHREMWPKDFKWCFWSCQNCAMGLTQAFWKLDNIKTSMSGYMLNTFHMPRDIIDRIFFGGYGTYTNIDHPVHTVSSEMVADKIDEYLSKSMNI